jgi:glycosyltransferase involved in cell wall biosynthesis
VNDTQKPIRILHVVGGMDTGGVETWLMHVLRKIDRDRYKFDFLTHTTKPCFYDEELRALGCRITPCLHPTRPLCYARNFRRIMRKHGPYDVVHSHVHHFSGFPLMLAHWAGVPVRIAHSHNDISLKDRGAAVWRRLYLLVSECHIRRHATLGLACSHPAAAALYGCAWERDPRWRVLYYAIDVEPYTRPIDMIGVRDELGIPADAFVVGHVGRFVEQKNHDFLLDIFSEVARREPRARLLLVGDGPLRAAVDHKARRLGLSTKIIFAGVRRDVPRLMSGAMDVFVLPSRHEGLGLVVVEAQAAGLGCLVSDAVPKEADVVPLLVNRLALSQPAMWAERILAETGRRIQPEDAWRRVDGSHFNLSQCVSNLAANYATARNVKERLS